MILTTLKIEGMMCGMCEAHVRDAIRFCDSVVKMKIIRIRFREASARDSLE